MAFVLALALILLVLAAVVVVVTGDPNVLPISIDSRCTNLGYSCGVVAGLATTFVSVVAAVALFLLVRLRKVGRPLVRRARYQTREYVESAGTIFGSVVGRRELCNVIIDDLKDRRARRPHVIVGGVGVGKTAVLVELTRLLARSGAVPVPIRLRDAGDQLDFVVLARDRFIREARHTAHSDAEAERVWRELIRDDRIVVLADGLEEALIGSADTPPDGDREGGPPEGHERDIRISVAVEEARRCGLPLVIASRPHDALFGLPAAAVELEPLGDEYALEYIKDGSSIHDEHRLIRLIETAEVTETPLYLQIAHDLELKHLLGRARAAQDDRLDTRGGDRVGLRVGLLETYIAALIEGHFHAEVPIDAPQRRATVTLLGALACAGLRVDSIEVRFSDLNALPEIWDTVFDAVGRTVPEEDKRERALRRELRQAAIRGARLGLVERRGNGVRFPHSIMQAYLASRVLVDIVDREQQPRDFLDEALDHSGRELLAALVMHSRRPGGPRLRQQRPAARWEDRGKIGERLTRQASTSDDEPAKLLSLLVAALEIDCVVSESQHGTLAATLQELWPKVNENRAVEQAKLDAIARFGQVARRIEARRTDAQGQDGVSHPRPGWLELYRIACDDVWYPARIAATQQLAGEGEEAFRQIHDRLGHTAAGVTGADIDWKDEDSHRELVIRAWLTPLLLTTIADEQSRSQAKSNVKGWLEYVTGTLSAAERAPLSLEIALAQGFKHAANRRAGGSRLDAETRAFLAQRAASFLEEARSWFSQLTLLHALCLWALSDRAEGSAPVTRPTESGIKRNNHDHAESRGSDAAALVDHWLSGAEHPFVRQAGLLAVLALQTGHPERYMWIDEAGVVSSIGARRPSADAPHRHSLWIPPSTGWSALDRRAQRLVADVLILLNLAERGTDEPEERERRLKRLTRNELPSCLKGDRVNLEPDRTVGMVEEPTPGARCKDDCPFDLCPYPPKGPPSKVYRAELSEAFCRRQQVLLGRWFYRRRAPWQDALPSELRRFWLAMESRARR